MTIWLEKVKVCVGWDTVDQTWVSKLYTYLDSDLHEVIEAITNCLVQLKDTQSLLTNTRFVQRLHDVLQEWLMGPLSGEFDEAYVQARRAFVHRLAEVDLTFEDVILVEGVARERLLELALAHLDEDDKTLAATARALSKALRLDMALIHRGYTQIRDAEIERSTLDRFLAVTGFSRSLYENLAEAREWADVSLQQGV